MLRKLLEKRWPIILICTVLVVAIAGIAVGRSIPSKSVFAHVNADDTGTQIDFFIANSGWIPYQFSCRLQLLCQHPVHGGGRAEGGDAVLADHGQDLLRIEAVEVVDENRCLAQPLTVDLAPAAPLLTPLKSSIRASLWANICKRL